MMRHESPTKFTRNVVTVFVLMILRLQKEANLAKGKEVTGLLKSLYTSSERGDVLMGHPKEREIVLGLVCV